MNNKTPYSWMQRKSLDERIEWNEIARTPKNRTDPQVVCLIKAGK